MRKKCGKYRIFAYNLRISSLRKIKEHGIIYPLLSFLKKIYWLKNIFFVKAELYFRRGKSEVYYRVYTDSKIAS